MEEAVMKKCIHEENCSVTALCGSKAVLQSAVIIAAARIFSSGCGSVFATWLETTSRWTIQNEHDDGVATEDRANLPTGGRSSENRGRRQPPERSIQ